MTRPAAEPPPILHDIEQKHPEAPWTQLTPGSRHDITQDIQRLVDHAALVAQRAQDCMAAGAHLPYLASPEPQFRCRHCDSILEVTIGTEAK